MKKIIALLLLLPWLCFGDIATPPFDYDLHITSLPGKNSRMMICCHGYGGNYRIALQLKQLKMIDATLVSFNFPDHDIEQGKFDPQQAAFGTIKELLPLFYVLKKYVIDEGHEMIDLYGFSAGGGAVINFIATLNRSMYDAELKKIGIGSKEKEKILNAIQKGVVILDTPLKSIEEITDLRGSTPELEIIAKHYRENQLRPIDSLEYLKGLSLHVIVHFQKIDEVIFNRDDALYIDLLKQANSSGTTDIIIGIDEGHIGSHLSLWDYYCQKIQGKGTLP